MKNKEYLATKIILVIILIVVLIFASVLVVEQLLNSSDSTNTTEAFKFKNEYETLNGKVENELKYVDVEINKKNIIKYLSYDDLLELLESGTGAIYIGSPKDNNSRILVNKMLPISTNIGLDEIFYYNIDTIIDEKELGEDGEIITITEGTEEYFKLVELLGGNVGTYNSIKNSEKRINIPVLLVTDKGTILAYKEFISSEEIIDADIEDILYKVLECDKSC